MIIHLITKKAGFGVVTACGLVGIPGQKGFHAVEASDPKQAATCPACRKAINSHKMRATGHSK